MDIYLTKECEKNLEAIYHFAYMKWRDGKIEDKPTRAKIVRKLINGLYESMVEDGQIVN